MQGPIKGHYNKEPPRVSSQLQLDECLLRRAFQLQGIMTVAIAMRRKTVRCLVGNGSLYNPQ